MMRDTRIRTMAWIMGWALWGIGSPGCSAPPMDSQALVASANGTDPNDGEIDVQDLATFQYANERYQKTYGLRLPEARLVPRSGSTLSGSLKIHPTSDRGLKIIGIIKGLPPGGTHGMALHEGGSCASADARSAGDLYGPEGSRSSRDEARSPSPNGLGNVTSDAAGTVRRVSFVLPGVAIEEVIGRTVVLHRDRLEKLISASAGTSLRWGCGEILIPPSRTAIEPRE